MHIYLLEVRYICYAYISYTQLHLAHHHPTTRLDDKEFLDGFLSRMDEIERDSDEAVTKARRRVDEVCANM